MGNLMSNRKTSASLVVLFLVVNLNAAVVLGAAVSQHIIEAKHFLLAMVLMAMVLSSLVMKRVLGEKLTLAFCDLMAICSASVMGPGISVILVATNHTLLSSQSERSIRETLYSAASHAASINAACYIARAIFPSFGGEVAQSPSPDLPLAVAVCAMSYFVISTSLVASYESFANEESFFELMQASFLFTSMRLLLKMPSAFGVYVKRQLNYDESRPHRRMRVGEVLIARGIISRKDLLMALESQRRSIQPAMRVGEILVQMGLVEERQVAEALGVNRCAAFSAA